MKRMFGSFIEFLRRSKKTVLLIIIVAAITLILSTMISIWLSTIDNYLIPSLGTIRTTAVKAYGIDITVEGEDQHIDWGTVYPGSLTNRSFNVESQSNIKTTLALITANLTFLDSEGENVTESLTDYEIMRNESMYLLPWNYTGALISPGQKIHVTLTLWASNDIRFINYLIDKEVQEFAFDIHIYAEE